MKLTRLTALSGLVAAALAVLPCQASTIKLGINGDAELGSNYIDFGQYPVGAPYAPAPGYGTFEVSLVTPGVFQSAGVLPGEFGNIQSLSQTSGSISLPNAFMTFNTGGSNLQLFATSIPAGTTGPLTLFDTPSGAVAAFNVNGYIYDTNTKSTIDTFTGTFSATFGGETVSALMSSLPVATPFSATFTADVTPTPEPSSLLLLGAGLSGLGAFARRKRAKA